MDELSLIRLAHEVDGQLGQLATSVKAESLREEILALQVRWRELAYAVSAELCGANANVVPATPVRRRGRPRKGPEQPTDATEHGSSAVAG
jgi:hypothetical protein